MKGDTLTCTATPTGEAELDGLRTTTLDLSVTNQDRTEQRTALQWRDPVCARKGCDNRLGLQYDHFEDWAHTHTTRVEAARRFCTPCHRLKTTGWHVSAPDSNGQCTFTQPADAEPSPPGTTATPELAEAVQAALRARRNALART